jgi:thioredoxin 1
LAQDLYRYKPANEIDAGSNNNQSCDNGTGNQRSVKLIKGELETMASENVVHVTDDNFDAEVLKSDTPVLVDFWAAWCGPCKMIAPIVDQIADAHVGKVKVAKCDTEVAQRIPGQYGIRGIPTLILFNKGQVVDQVVGAVPKEVIEGLIAKAS